MSTREGRTYTALVSKGTRRMKERTRERNGPKTRVCSPSISTTEYYLPDALMLYTAFSKARGRNQWLRHLDLKRGIKTENGSEGHERKGEMGIPTVQKLLRAVRADKIDQGRVTCEVAV
jgi:hypothetical protein